jgi:hypothetical protein
MKEKINVKKRLYTKQPNFLDGCDDIMEGYVSLKIKSKN